MDQHGRGYGRTNGVGPSALTREALVAALRALPFQFSGLYEHEGGARTGGRRNRVGGTEPNDAVLRSPLYRLAEPIYLEETTRRSMSREEPVRFSLAIDVDGTDPLGIVSGSIAGGGTISGAPPAHFIGRVIENRATTFGRKLVVGDFEFEWPGTSNRIGRLEIALTGSPVVVPTARVTFVDIAQTRRHGPFVAEHQSTYFRHVEVDVDREANAIDPEPLSTHLHPDRPDDLPAAQLTLEDAFGAAGVRISRSVDTPAPVTGAGANHRWSYAELHDSMVLHWEAFANRPQWKMWIFLAERADDDSLGGVMFDGDIDEPGGVDRQGTALFTRCPFFHTVEGDYPKANPPEAEAVKRELFFNLIHETGHAFNLAHSFQKHEGMGWRGPDWMPLASNAQALSWMNYPDAAAEGRGGGPANATWFYRRFRFRFDEGELLFLRHAPDRYLQMGGEVWFDQHARVARATLDSRLQLSIRTLKTIFEQGEPVVLELKLKNVSNQPVMVHRNLDPSDGLVDLAVTNPQGERRPFLPFDHTRTRLVPHILEPGAEAVYSMADVTMGAFGFPFKEPGAYRIEASYTNLDGRTAAAVYQLYVRPASSYAAVPVINELYDAKIGRALYVEGTRVQEDVNKKIDWIRKRLAETIGDRNPIEAHLRTVRYKPLMNEMSVIQPESNVVRSVGEEPDVAIRQLETVLVERASETADTMGHIWYIEVMQAYTRTAQRAGELGKARQARSQLMGFCRDRGIVPSVTQAVERAAANPEPV